MITYGKQSINNDDIVLVKKILKSTHLTQGPTIQKFENQLKKNLNQILHLQQIVVHQLFI